MSFVGELRRRNVLRVATAYAAVAWLVVQILDTLAPIFGISEGTARIIVIVLAIGFIPAMIVAWVFELTPDGLKREGDVDHSSQVSKDSAKSLDRVVIGLLALAVVYFAFDKFILDPARDQDVIAEATEQARNEALVSSYGEHSIAVMPFSDLSPASDQEYFSDGIAEEIINLLSRIRNLRVIARSSAFSFKGQNLAASVVAERLNVRYIMEGSIRRAGERLRITATVIDASTDTQLWSENFDRNFDDIFAIQDEIAGEVVDRMEMQISGRLPSVNRVNPESYSLYLQAKHLLTRQNKDSTLQADELLKQALQIDSTNVAAWLLSESVYGNLAYWGFLTREEVTQLSLDAFDQVLALDPGNAKALTSKLFYGQAAQDTWLGELEAVTYTLRLMPTDVQANQLAARVLSAFGRFELSLEYSEYVLGKDPMCGGCLRSRIYTLMATGEYAAAEKLVRRLTAITGGSGTYTLGLIQFLQGQNEKALETMLASGTLPFVIMQGRAIVNWEMGLTENYEQALAELEATVGDEEFAKLRVRPEDFLAGVYAWVGRDDDAFEILDELINPPASWGPNRWSIDPIFNTLHDDPRWLTLLEKAELSLRHIESYELEKRFPGPGLVPNF